MTQRSFHWNGASLGDADELAISAADGIGFRLANEDYESPFVDVGLRMLLNGDGNRGVLSGWLNELAVAGVGTPITVDTGGAIVYGMPYENTVSVNVAVPSPTTDTRQDYIVLRRNWADQEVRITRIEGVEGGSIPAITQSPAPDGTGIYDVPLATLSITTGGVITVTDAREYNAFSTTVGDDALGTSQLQNNCVDWTDRATRTCRMFLGGGDLEPWILSFRYLGPYYDNPFSYYVTSTGTPTWDGAANEEGWTLTGSAYEGAMCEFRVPPPNWAYGDITAYVWWVENAGVASTFYLRTAAQLYGIQPYFLDSQYPLGSYSSVYINETLVAHQVYRTAGISIPASKWSGTAQEDQLEVCKYLAYWYNSAGAESINILGIEFQYTGYV